MAEAPADIPVEPAERVRYVLTAVRDALGVEGEVDVEESGDEIRAEIVVPEEAADADEVGLLIGRHGQTIDALQVLCSQAAFRGTAPADRKRVTVDAAGYRARRSEVIERQADIAAEEALRIGGSVDMEPMSSAERRIAHEHLRDRSEVETYSEGDEPERFVVVAPLVDA